MTTIFKGHFVKYKTLAQIDYSLYFSSVGFVAVALSSLLFFVFLYLGWETEKYPILKIRILLYLVLLIAVMCIIALANRCFIINKILNDGKDDEAEIRKYVKERNDCIKLYLKTAEQGFICSLRRNRKNRSVLDNELKEGIVVDIMHIKKNAILTKYYT